MAELTSRQAQVLQLIIDHTDQTGFPPTRAEIAKALGFKSVNAAEAHLKALVKKQAIEIIPGASRGIRVLESSSSSEQGIPIVGHVAAGEPIISADTVEEYCGIPENFFHPSADFLLRVRGDSMINIGIFDGDLLAVHHTTVANEGDIVVARVDDEVTVKRIHYPNNRQYVQLIAENLDYSPIIVDLSRQSCVIEGVHVGIIRR